MTEKEISRLKEDNFNNEHTIEKFQRDFRVFDEKIKTLEAKNKEFQCVNSEMQQHIDCLKEDLVEAQNNKVQLPSEPIKVAEMLIDATETRENCMTGTEYDKSVYEKWQLEQIARHLLVYCGKYEE